MKRLWITLALAALAVASVWLWAPKDVVQGNSAPAQTTVAAVQSAAAMPSSPTAAGDVARVSTKRRVDAKQRAAYLRRIADGVNRARTAGDDNESDAPEEAAAAEAPKEAEHEPDPAGDGPQAIADKSDGELSDLVAAVNEDLLPLADECYQAATERDPTIAGMIDINLEMAGDEDVGGIVESFELGEENEIEDAQMVECIRETTLSTIFPAPTGTGRRGARLTLRFEPDPPE